jgi:AcrR family transcriptional regulator
MEISDWGEIHVHILTMEQAGLVTRTFRRLDAVRQQAVLNAILGEAAENGPAAINIRQVAARAGVSTGSLYQYFHNRNGLVNFAIELCLRYYLDMFAAIRPHLFGLPLREALALYVRGGVELSQTQMGLVQFFGRAAYQGDPDLRQRVVEPIAAAMWALERDLLAAAAERGELHPGIDLDAATHMVHALILVVGDSQLFPYLNSYFRIVEENFSPQQGLDAMLDFILNSIATHEAPS